MISKKITLLDNIAGILIFFICLSAVFPMFLLFFNNAILCLICELLWLVIAFLRSRRIIFKILVRYWYMQFYMFYTAFMPYIGKNPSIGNRYIYTFSIIFGFYIFLFYEELGLLNLIGKVVYALVPFFLFTFFKTYMAAFQNPWVLRQIDNSTSVGLLSQGIGGYSYIYFLNLLFGVSIVSSFQCKGFIKVISLCFSIIIIILVTLSNFFTAFSLCILCIIIMVSRRYYRLLVPVLLAIVFLYVLDSSVILDIEKFFLQFLSQDGRIFAVLSATGNKSLINLFFEEFLRDRWPTLLMSIQAFIRNPFLGIIKSPILNNGVYDTAYGQHSYILDTFALYGFLIGFLNIFIMLHPFFCYKVYIKSGMNYRKLLLIVIIVLTVFNNITHSIAIASTIICPYFVYKMNLFKYNRK